MRNELSNEVSNSELKAELQALRKKLEGLEAEQAAFKSGADGTVRRRFPKPMIVASISVMALLVGSGLLWGDDIKALFIDKDGVHINGAVKMNGGDVGIEKALKVAGNANFSSNVGIGADDPKAKLQVAGNMLIDGATPGKAHIATNAYLFNSTPNSSTPTWVWRIKDTAKKAVAIELNESGTIGLWATQTPGQTDWLPIGINGERVPVKFDIPAGGSVPNQGIAICTDNGGCRITLRMYNSSNNDVLGSTVGLYLHGEGGQTNSPKTNYTRVDGAGKDKWGWWGDTVFSYDDWCHAKTNTRYGQLDFSCKQNISAKVTITAP